MKRESGFTLIEMLVVVAILGFVLGATTDTFVNLLRNYKQQGKIAETNFEGLIGLDLLRRDIENAGFGLPWVIPSGMTYTEAQAPLLHAPTYNEPANQPPHPILNGNDGWIDAGSGLANSGYLVIKATNVASNKAAQLWTYLTSNGTRSWTPASENPQQTDYMTVLSPGSGTGDMRTLVNVGIQYQNITPADPNDQEQPKLVYGVWDNSLGAAPLRPFNRADYEILSPSQSGDMVPSRCAPNTGEFVKEVLSQADGSKFSEVLPLLDCAADMYVSFKLDTNGDGTAESTVEYLNPALYSAYTIRTQLREVRVYILAQEGQKDSSYTSPPKIWVGDYSTLDGHWYNLGTNLNYRWKVYSIIIQPKNLKQSYGDTG